MQAVWSRACGPMHGRTPDERPGFAGASLPAWAVDAKGASVPTHFEADGNVLRQVVSHTSAKVTCPVVADPYMGKALISKVTKIAEKKPRYGRG